jgi:hypothetical protein
MAAAATIIGAMIGFAGTMIQTAVQAAGATVAEEPQAANSVQAMKNLYGNGVSTLVTIANGTGGPMTIRDSGDSSGHIWKYPYPPQIEAGQIGCFLHVHTSGTAGGSVGAVQYYLTPSSVKSPPSSASTNAFIFAWSTPYSSSNSVLVVDNSALNTDYKTVFNNMGKAGGTTNVNSNGFSATGSIGQGTSPACNFNVTYSGV